MNTANKTAKDLLFVGDSLIEYYDWQNRFPNHRVSNLGVAGETVTGLLGRLQQFLPPHSSQALMLIMIGTNNILMEDFSFLPAYEQLIDIIKNNHPSTELVINGLFPIKLPWMADKAITQVNTLLEELAHSKEIGYLDGYKIFNAQPADKEYFLDDGVHISKYGYHLWSRAIAQLMAS